LQLVQAAGCENFADWDSDAGEGSDVGEVFSVADAFEDFAGEVVTFGGALDGGEVREELLATIDREEIERGFRGFRGAGEAAVVSEVEGCAGEQRCGEEAEEFGGSPTEWLEVEEGGGAVAVGGGGSGYGHAGSW
jgi:hypothetical protein